MVKEFVPLKRISCVVYDEAANMVAAGRQLHEEINCESSVCAAHMLQICLHYFCNSSQQIQKLLNSKSEEAGWTFPSQYLGYRSSLFTSVNTKIIMMEV